MTSSDSATWDESQCSAALVRLERLQAQLDDLRLTIPRVVQPFYSPLTPSMFNAFKNNLAAAGNDMKDFRRQWEDPKVQNIFAHSKQSLQANQDLTMSTEVPKYGWVGIEGSVQENTQSEGKETKTEREPGFDLSEEDIRKIVEDWKAKNDKINVQAEDEYRSFKVLFTSDLGKLEFHITVEQEPEGVQKLQILCSGTQEPAPTITRCVSTRPRKNDLGYLLDMIAAYKTVKSKQCAKCNKLFDSQTSQPVARRTREVAHNEETNSEWEAFHEGCIE